MTETYRIIKDLKLSTRALGVLRGLRAMATQKDKVVDVREKLFRLAEEQGLSTFQLLARARNCGMLTTNQICVAFALP